MRIQNSEYRKGAYLVIIPNKLKRILLYSMEISVFSKTANFRRDHLIRMELHPLQKMKNKCFLRLTERDLYL